MALAAAALVYGIVAVLQFVDNTALQVQTIGVLALLAIAITVSWGSDEHRLQTCEMAILWIAVLLFAAYTALKLTGVV